MAQCFCTWSVRFKKSQPDLSYDPFSISGDFLHSVESDRTDRPTLSLNLFIDVTYIPKIEPSQQKHCHTACWAEPNWGTVIKMFCGIDSSAWIRKMYYFDIIERHIFNTFILTFLFMLYSFLDLTRSLFLLACFHCVGFLWVKTSTCLGWLEHCAQS